MPKIFRILLAFSLFTCLPYNTNAQLIDMSIGIRGGLTLASYSRDVNFGSTILDESLSSGSIPRVTGGVAFNVKMINYFGLQFEGMLVNKGGVVEANTLSGQNLTPVNRNYTTNLDYIQFALIPKFIIDQTPGFGFFGGAGLYAAFLTNAKEEVQASTFQQSLTTGRDISNSIKGTDFGFLVTGGVQISSFVIEGRYSAGFVNIISDPSLNQNISAKNGVVTFIIGYNFSLL